LADIVLDDEVIEITPVAIRARKKELDANKRKSQTRKGGFDFGNPVEM
jgi:GTP-binding protein